MIKFKHRRSDMALYVENGGADYIKLAKDSEWIEQVQKVKETVTETEDKELSYKELKELAKEKNIPGYTRLSKEKLIEALNTEPLTETLTEELTEEEDK